MTVIAPLSRAINIDALDPPGERMRLALGDGSTHPTTPSGWSLVARPKRKSLTEWVGVEPYRFACPVVLGSNQATSVEADAERLRRLERVPYVAAGDRRPATLRISTPTLPAVFWRLTWVLQSIEWGSVEYSGEVGWQRWRQEATLEFLEWVDVDLLVEESPAARAKARAS